MHYPQAFAQKMPVGMSRNHHNTNLSSKSDQTTATIHLAATGSPASSTPLMNHHHQPLSPPPLPPMPHAAASSDGGGEVGSGGIGIGIGIGGVGESTIDAAHIHFRERLGPLQTYHCHTCDDRFQAHSLLGVMEHFVRHSSTCSAFHSACLYCGGKVHSYSLETRRRGGESEAATDEQTGCWTPETGAHGGGRRYYHDCGRWRRRQDK